MRTHARTVGTSVLAQALPVARSLAAAVLAWWVFSLVLDRPLSLPSPPAVFAAWWDLLASGDLVSESLVSLRRLGVAYALAAATGIPLGFAMAHWRTVDRAVGPLVNSVRAVSGIAWIPIAVVWFGVGEELPVFIIFYGAVFPFILNAQAALRNIDDRLITVARTLGAGPMRITLAVVLPAALPYLLTGARIALGLAWMSIIAADLLGAPSGLGFSIQYARMIQQTPKMLAWILWVGAVGYLLDAAMRGAVAALAPWAKAGRVEGGAP
jgi:ABC-type nitrate/sulfonate/bicarbonate transport system permease component